MMSPRKNKPRIKFYAVATGRKTGVFLQWSSAQASVDRHPGASHRGFVTIQGAVDFLETIGMDNKDIIVYDNDTTFSLDNYLVRTHQRNVDVPDDNDGKIDDDNHVDGMTGHVPDDIVNNENSVDIDVPNDNPPVADNAVDGGILIPVSQEAQPPNDLPDEQAVAPVCTTKTECKPLSQAPSTPVTEPQSQVHASCLSLIRDLENSLVDKLYGVMQENYATKLQLVHKDLDICRQSNATLAKENNKLIAENARLQNVVKDNKCPGKCTTEEKLHKLRLDLEQMGKSRHQQYLSDKAELQRAISSLQTAHQKHDAVVLEKEKQISSLQDRLAAADAAVIKAQDAAYEAKRTQTLVPNDNFIAVTKKSSRPPSTPPNQTPLVPAVSTADLVPSTVTIPMQRQDGHQESFATVVARTPSKHDRSFQNSSPPRFLHRQDRAQSKSDRPTVIVIGNSHLARVDAARLVPQADVTLVKAFTVQEAADRLEHLPFVPSCIVIHEITNDVKLCPSPVECASYLHSVVDYYAAKYIHTRFIISLGLPRVDDFDLDTKTEMVNVFLKSGIKNNSYAHNNVTFCDHSNFYKNGITQRHLLDPADGYHLSDEGTKVLSSNLRCKVEVMLNLRYRKG